MLYLLIHSLIIILAVAFDESKFQTCNAVPHCRRYFKYTEKILRNNEKSELPRYVVSNDSILLASPKHNKNFLEFALINTVDNKTLLARVLLTSRGIIRMTLDENPLESIYKRYQVLKNEILEDTNLERDAYETEISYDNFSTYLAIKVTGRKEFSPDFEVHVHYKPFSLQLYTNKTLLQSLNQNQLLNFERYRQNQQDTITSSLNEHNLKVSDSNEIYENNFQNISIKINKNFVDAVDLDSDGIWEHSFNSFVDKKKNGPSAVGIDITFPKAFDVFGLPLHATELSLSDFIEPYRAWNLDVFEYQLNSPVALYGTIPFLIAMHNLTQEVVFTGILWINPSDTWIKINKSLNTPDKEIQANFVSETGVLDLLMFVGPNTSNLLKQYHFATGYPAMPPVFSIGKHQSKWNYYSDKEVLEIQYKYDENEIPLDSIWLDIEYTDEKKYFTWNSVNFPDPESLVSVLSQNEKKLVAIIDPHIKRDTSYSVYNELLKHNSFLRDGEADTYFHGWCWPGDSFYPDFMNETVRKLFGSFYQPGWWRGSTKNNLFVWNDMNEPSVFNKLEVTSPKGVLHHDGREHRELHNLYGLYFHRTTYEALLERNPNQRPFILSRSFFVGSHRYGAVWTGDNMANWEHLRIAVPMILSQAISGMSFTGADVGGFFGYTSPELMIRWMQQGVWYPFFRAHSHIESARKEPWTFNSNVMELIRDAVYNRYRLLPYWYTLFAQYALMGDPILRPLWWNSNTVFDENMLTFQNEEFFCGDCLLIRSISQPLSALEVNEKICETMEDQANGCDNVKKHIPTVKVFLPRSNGTSEVEWFDYYTSNVIYTRIPVLGWSISMERIPVFVKAGCILPLKGYIRRSTAFQSLDPYTLEIFLNDTNKSEGIVAIGSIYIDDGNTFDYKNLKSYIYDEILLQKIDEKYTLILKPKPLQVDEKKSSALMIGNAQNISVNRTVEKIILHGFFNAPRQVVCKSINYEILLKFKLIQKSNFFTVIIKKPTLSFGEYNKRIVFLF